MYFTIDIQSAEDKENIFFDDGYYSEYANEAANNKVLVLRIKTKISLILNSDTLWFGYQYNNKEFICKHKNYK